MMAVIYELAWNMAAGEYSHLMKLTYFRSTAIQTLPHFIAKA